MASPNEYMVDDDVIELTGTDFNEKSLIKSEFKNRNALIKFYAPWCGHCKKMVPDLKFLAKGLKNHGFMIGAVNVTQNENKEIAGKFGVSGIPSLFMANSQGNLEPANLEDRSIESILKKICEYTNKKTCYNRNNLGN